MIRLYGFPLSLNVDRVAIALAHKELSVEVVRIDPADREAVREVSGQDLVPVIVDDGAVIHDSTAILLYLEDRYPERPLLPEDPARRAEIGIFLDWFNRVWKRPPNAIVDEEAAESPDETRIARLGGEITASLDRFESLLAGREFLFGERLTVADCAAYPFLKYAVEEPVDDPWRFHHVLREHESRGGHRPRLEGWIGRMRELPQIPV